jgi:serine/threonine protein kinase
MLNHNTVYFGQHLETPELYITAYELMEGGDLLSYLQSRERTAAQSALSEEEARGVFLQIMDGLSYAHAHNVIHRDLRLENIL